MSQCSLSGRGQGHVSNFYIVNLENFVTASHRYTGDIHDVAERSSTAVLSCGQEPRRSDGVLIQHFNLIIFHKTFWVEDENDRTPSFLVFNPGDLYYLE